MDYIEQQIDDLKYIKKHYGEKMMKLCEKLFPTIIDYPGELSKIMKECFYPSKYLYYDLINEGLKDEFQDYIIQKFKKTPTLIKTTKSPQELMKEKGYELYECHTESDIQSFRKYYSKQGKTYPEDCKGIPKHIGEEICTFDGKRLDYCHVFFAVKEGADKLKREDFDEPRRQDEYGTSVISIQFTRNRYILSIKNRYNDTVHNPDATFGNDLDNIIQGLTYSFEKYYGFKSKQKNEVKFEIPQYIEVDGKFYKYNYKIHNIYYCPNNIIIQNGKMKQYPQEQYIIMDYYILDIKNKKIILIDEAINDELIEIYKDIEQIEIKKTNNKKQIIITTSDGIKSTITVNNKNEIIEYENNKVKQLKGNFMTKNKTLIKISLKNLEKMGPNCFELCKTAKEIRIPQLKEMGTSCFSFVDKINRLELPELQIMQPFCFNYIKSVEIMLLPKIEIIGDYCFCNCSCEIIEFPKLKTIGSYCFNAHVKEITLPQVETVGYMCFCNCNSTTKIYAPKIAQYTSGIIDNNHHKM